MNWARLWENGPWVSVDLSSTGLLGSPLRWLHNGRNSVSKHQPHNCLLNRLFRRRSKKTSKLRITGLCVGNSLGPVNSPHMWPVTWKIFPFDDLILTLEILAVSHTWYNSSLYCYCMIWNYSDHLIRIWMTAKGDFFQSNSNYHWKIYGEMVQYWRDHIPDKFCGQDTKIEYNGLP